MSPSPFSEEDNNRRKSALKETVAVTVDNPRVDYAVEIPISLLQEYIDDALDSDKAKLIKFRSKEASITLKSLLGGPESMFDKVTLKHFATTPWVLIGIYTGLFTIIFSNCV